MGYADYSVSRVFTEPWPKYYGLDGNSKLTLDYQTEQSSSNVYCPYKDSIDHNQIYATIKQSAIDIKRQTKYTGHEKARDNSDRKHYALATRKNTILERTIRDTYADYLFMDKNEQRQKESITSNANWLANFESRTMRHVHFVSKAHHFSRKGYHTPMNSKHHDANVEPNIIDLLTVDSNAAPDALLARALEVEAMLRTIALSIFQFQPLFCYLENVKERINMHHKRKNVTLKRVEKLVIEKYRIATVEQVASVFPNDGAECNHYDLSLLTAEEATSFLIEDLIGDNLISTRSAGKARSVPIRKFPPRAQFNGRIL
ncbi:hypothetical protein ZHAS_00004726 [Anopheles sinensis]|uniref:Uncharacterized protein n=1 Tax=Anopheles sinensis TaxID=74873 RepID=A0A084VHQ9_ANOSI|nr:hypothetical protein ZHAS_00004726 [Anopheles sinensis]